MLRLEKKIKKIIQAFLRQMTVKTSNQLMLIQMISKIQLKAIIIIIIIIKQVVQIRRKMKVQQSLTVLIVGIVKIQSKQIIIQTHRTQKTIINNHRINNLNQKHQILLTLVLNQIRMKTQMMVNQMKSQKMIQKQIKIRTMRKKKLKNQNLKIIIKHHKLLILATTSTQNGTKRCRKTIQKPMMTMNYNLSFTLSHRL